MRYLLTIFFLVLLSTVAFAQSDSVVQRVSQLSYPQPQKLFAMSDIHADADAFVALLLEMKLINKKGEWSQENAHLVINGDVLGRGKDSRFILDFILKLKSEAKKKNSHITLNMGNHEIFILVGEFEYVPQEDMAQYADGLPIHEVKDRYEQYVKNHRTTDETSRRRSFLDAWHQQAYLRALSDTKSPYATLLNESKVFTRVGDTLFVHAGLEDWVLDKDFVEQANLTLHRIVVALQQHHMNPQADKQPIKAAYAHPLFQENGPLRTRALARERPGSFSLEKVKKLLEAMGVKKVVIGHTPIPTRNILVDYEGLVVRTDTLMSQGFGNYGPIMGVEIKPSGQVQAVHADRPRGKHPLRMRLQKQFEKGREHLRHLGDLNRVLKAPKKSWLHKMIDACSRIFSEMR